MRIGDDSGPLSQPLEATGEVDEVVDDKSSMSLADSDNLLSWDSLAHWAAAATGDADGRFTDDWADSIGAKGDNCSLLGLCGLLLADGAV